MNSENLFQTIGNKELLVNRVVSEIEGLIVGGRLAPGMKLPPERELAEQVGVSRTVIREASHILAAKGLLETKPGVGTTVRQVTRDEVAKPLNLLLRSQYGGICFEDLHQVRSILEIEIAEIAASKATEADIAALKQIIADMKSKLESPEVFAARDADFHQALAQTTHNPLLIHLSGVVRDLLQEYLLLVVPHIDLRKNILPYHNRILERVIARDQEGARHAMREHLEQIMRNHQEVFDRGTGGVTPLRSMLRE